MANHTAWNQFPGVLRQCTSNWPTVMGAAVYILPSVLNVIPVHVLIAASTWAGPDGALPPALEIPSIFALILAIRSWNHDNDSEAAKHLSLIFVATYAMLNGCKEWEAYTAHQLLWYWKP